MAVKKKSGVSKDPFGDDGDDDDVVERDVANVLEGNSPGDEEVDELEVGDPVDEPPRPSRDERRANRYREAQERAEAAEQRATAAEARAAAIEAVRQQAPAPAPQNQEDPLRTQLDTVYKRQTQLSKTYAARAGKTTPEEEEDFMRQARELDEERISLIHQRAQRSVPQLTPEAIRREAIIGQVQDRHSDVLKNPQYSAYATGTYQQLLAEGYADTMDTADMAMERTRTRFGLTAKDSRGRDRAEPAPTQQQRNRYAGTPQGGPGGARPKTNTIQITPEIRAMANGAYSHIKGPGAERQRLQKWVNGPGKELLKQRNGG